jgi:L-iditol 2-dehydrogenase
MRAFLFEGTNKISLTDVPEPSHTADSAMIKILATSICGTDLRTYRFGSSKINPPRVLGHEVVGRIESVGSNVKGFSAGDRVQVAPAIGCGVCKPCRDGHTNLCDNLKTIGFQYDGTFADYMEIPADAFAMGNVTRVEPGVPDTEAVLSEPIACVVNAQEYLNIGKGDTVAIFGSGFIGCMHAELAWRQGASKVIMIELNAHRRAMAKAMMPDLIAIDPAEGPAVDAVLAATGGDGVDVAITACSSGDAQRDAMKIVAKRGRISLFGGLPAGTPSSGFIDSNLIHYREILVYGVHASTAAQNRKVLSMITSGELSVKQFSNDIFPLSKIEDAFAALNGERIMKAIITPGA